MKIIIESDEIKGASIYEACTAMGQEVDNDTNLGNRIKQIANNTNKGVFDITEAIVTHIFYTGNDYVFED